MHSRVQSPARRVGCHRQPATEVAQEFGLGTSLLYKRIGKNPQPGQLGGAERRAAGEEAAAAALPRLRREIAHLKLEIYLAVVIDPCSRRRLGWSLGDHLRSDLVVAALPQAISTRPAGETIFHSDRGSQYGSAAFRQALAGAGLRQSMSARANPHDNAWTESFIGTLKGEMLEDGCFYSAALLGKPRFCL